MNARVCESLKALVLVGTAIFLANKLFSGGLYYYIAPRFAWLSLVAVGLLLALAQSYGYHAEKDKPHHDHGGHTRGWHLLIVALPVILGTLVSPRPLGTDAAGQRGAASAITVPAGGGRTLTISDAERDIFDWAVEMSKDRAAGALDGRLADVTGFVYRDERFKENQFMVSRFVVVCCVADAVPVGLVVEAPDGDSFPDDAWVQVKGVFAAGSFDGEPMPVLEASAVTAVTPPLHPYLYP
jgi:uncharacterized repeat protein (TIGR03943 family)